VETSTPASTPRKMRETHASPSMLRRRETHAPLFMLRRRETRHRPRRGGGGRLVAVRAEEEEGDPPPSAPRRMEGGALPGHWRFCVMGERGGCMGREQR
jgi:hypothetical protein